jgi:hypothetical protein
MVSTSGFDFAGFDFAQPPMDYFLHECIGKLKELYYICSRKFKNNDYVKNYS